MPERESGWYWVRRLGNLRICWWNAKYSWWQIGAGTEPDHASIKVLYGPIPGPEELRRMSAVAEYLDKQLWQFISVDEWLAGGKSAVEAREKT